MNYSNVINQVIEKSTEHNKPLYVAFIDYEKAFDSAQISAVLEESSHREYLKHI